MAAIFLGTAVIFLASKEVGCVEVNEETGEEGILEDCDEKVYGTFSPAALITNVATIAGVMIALILPVVGAIIDYTPYRWTVGVGCAILLVITNFVQIFTNAKTWFAMALLQVLEAVLFQVQVVASIAYLPEITREMGERSMNTSKLEVLDPSGVFCYFLTAPCTLI